jgi:hypothetical protein
MKAYGGVDVSIYLFLNSALVRNEWSVSRLGRFTPGQRASDGHSIGGWVGPRADLDGTERRNFLTLPGFELLILDHPERKQSLYLHYLL